MGNTTINNVFIIKVINLNKIISVESNLYKYNTSKRFAFE